ncbi:hypothetical protein TorRG33x02_275210, partial [Trema orientale]
EILVLEGGSRFFRIVRGSSYVLTAKTGKQNRSVKFVIVPSGVKNVAWKKLLERLSQMLGRRQDSDGGKKGEEHEFAPKERRLHRTESKKKAKNEKHRIHDNKGGQNVNSRD